MPKLKKSGFFSTILRGSEITHSNLKRIFIQSVIFLISCALAFLVAGFIYIRSQEPQINYLIWKYIDASGKSLWGQLLIWSPLSGGKKMAEQSRVEVRSGEEVYLYHPDDLIENLTPHLGRLAKSSLPWSFFGLAIWAPIQIIFFRWRGARAAADEVIRGGKKVRPRQLAALIKRRRDAGSFQIYNVPLLKGAQFEHILITGTTGKGKSTLLKHLISQMREQGHRFVVFDRKGEFLEIFYRAGIDHILYPLDGRSEYWVPWNDILEPPHADSIAQSLIPSDDPSSEGRFWTDASRILLSNSFRELRTRDMGDFIKEVVRVDFKRLANILQNTHAAAIISPDISKTALNVRATIASRTEPLLYLWKSRPEYALFSLRRYIDSDDPGCLFISSARNDYFKSMAPLYTTWVDIIVESILSNTTGAQHPLFLVLDELPSLGKLRSIQLLMAQGRSYGAACLLGPQNIQQLRDVYGDKGGDDLAGLCNTWISFAQPEPATAKWISDSLGQIEIDEYQESVGYGASRGANLRMTPTRHQRAIVTPDEIMQLMRGQFFLRLGQDYPVTQITTKVRDYPLIAPRFMQVDWNKTAYGPLEGRGPSSLGPARVNPGRPDLRLLD